MFCIYNFAFKKADRDDFMKKVIDVQTKNAKLEKDHRNATDKKNILAGVLKMYIDIGNAASAQLSKYQQERDYAFEENMKLLKCLSEYEKKFKEAQIKIAKLENGLGEYEKKFEETQMKNAKLENELGETKEEIVKLKEENTAFNKRCTQLSSQIVTVSLVFVNIFLLLVYFFIC